MGMDLMKVAAVAAAECVRQHVGLDRVVSLLTAYEYAVSHNLTREAFEQDGSSDLILALAGMVEPDNSGRFRVTPVTFRDGGSSAPHAEVARLVYNLTVHGDALTVDEWVKEFLWIHPFNDGNGRTGFLLYNILNGTLDSPVSLPYFFGEGPA